MKTNEEIQAAQQKIYNAIRTKGLSFEQVAVLEGIILGMAWCREGQATTVDRILSGEPIQPQWKQT